MTIQDRWAAIQFDQAVTTFGTVIENASQEQINVGGESSPKWVAKYDLADLLTDGFVIGGTGGGNSDGDALPTHQALGVPMHADGLIFDEVS